MRRSCEAWRVAGNVETCCTPTGRRRSDHRDRCDECCKGRIKFHASASLKESDAFGNVVASLGRHRLGKESDEYPGAEGRAPRRTGDSQMPDLSGTATDHRRSPSQLVVWVPGNGILYPILFSVIASTASPRCRLYYFPYEFISGSTNCFTENRGSNIPVTGNNIPFESFGCYWDVSDHH
jgi:hypothetical protein